MTSLSLSPSKQVISLLITYFSASRRLIPGVSAELRIKNTEKKRKPKKVHCLKLLKYLIRGTKY